MNVEQIVAVLIQERDRIEKAIQALGGGTVTTRGGWNSSGGKRKGRRAMSPTEKKAHSERMKAAWAKRRAAK